MGYYTQIDIHLKVKEDKLGDFKSEWEKLIRTYHEQTSDKELEWVLYYDGLTVEDDRSIEFEEYSRKWYDEDKFYEFIKDYVEPGYIQGQGEEFMDVWKVVFDGKGNYKTLEATFEEV